MKRSTRFSTRNEIFADTSGFYALLVQSDRAHAQASGLLSAAARTGGRFVTTDYVLDETATELWLRDALTTDKHFRQAGFNPLL